MERQYYVVTEEDIMDEQQTAIHFTNADYFEANDAQSDWTDEGVIETVIQGGFQAGELMEGVIEVQGSKEAVETYLKSVPEFEENESFSDFIQEFADLDC